MTLEPAMSGTDSAAEISVVIAQALREQRQGWITNRIGMSSVPPVQVRKGGIRGSSEPQTPRKTPTARFQRQHARQGWQCHPKRANIANHVVVVSDVD